MKIGDQVKVTGTTPAGPWFRHGETGKVVNIGPREDIIGILFPDGQQCSYFQRGLTVVNNKFMVAVAGGQAPKVYHDTYEIAEAEAKRLLTNQPHGRKAHVLEVRAVITSEVTFKVEKQ